MHYHTPYHDHMLATAKHIYRLSLSKRSLSDDDRVELIYAALNDELYQRLRLEFRKHCRDWLANHPAIDQLPDAEIDSFLAGRLTGQLKGGFKREKLHLRDSYPTLAPPASKGPRGYAN